VRSGREKEKQRSFFDFVPCERRYGRVVKIYGKCYSRYVEASVSKSPTGSHSFIFRFLSQLDHARVSLIPCWRSAPLEKSFLVRDRFAGKQKQRENKEGSRDKGNYLQSLGVYRHHRLMFSFLKVECRFANLCGFCADVIFNSLNALFANLSAAAALNRRNYQL